MSYVDFTGCIISPFGGCFLVPADNETKNPTKTQKILQALEEQDHPVSLHRLREHCSMRTATVSELLKQLIEKGDVHYSPNGYQINPLTRFPPIGTQGKGNGKH